MEAVSYKTSVVHPLISTTIQIRHAGYYWRSKDKLLSDILWTPTNGHTSIDLTAKTYNHQRVKGIHTVSMLWWWLSHAIWNVIKIIYILYKHTHTSFYTLIHYNYLYISPHTHTHTHTHTHDKKKTKLNLEN